MKMNIFKIEKTNTHNVINLLGFRIKLKKQKFSHIHIDDGNVVKIDSSVNKNKLKLNVRGKNNRVIIGNVAIVEELNISIYAENSTLVIGKDCGFRSLQIVMGADNCNAGLLKEHELRIGDRVSIEGAFIGAVCGNTKLLIGDDCMFSNHITIFNADSHPIFQKGTKTIINRSKDLLIGRHCWLGKNVTILKNTVLPNNTIVGCGSIVGGGAFKDENTVIAGNPAKVVKRDIDWHMDGSGDYINNEVLS